MTIAERPQRKSGLEPLSLRQTGTLLIKSFEDRASMAAAAAADIAAALSARIANRGAVRMIFAAAPSQAEALAELVAAPGIDWSRVTAFHMDDYIGLAADHPSGFANWLDTHLFSRVPFAAVHRLDPGDDPEGAAARYAEKMAEAPIDFVVLGIGENGHIAFNDPPVADFDDPVDVKPVVLDDVCRMQQVNDGCFPDFDSVPQKALTLTVPRLMRADRLFCLVPGSAKREAVRATLHGPVETACPASILRTHSACTLYLDRDSDPDA
ncbi:6-phosphogluconolactonase [Martelella endophytica]